eukprot:4805380-Amphidinium_carterae.1
MSSSSSSEVNVKETSLRSHVLQHVGMSKTPVGHMWTRASLRHDKVVRYAILPHRDSDSCEATRLVIARARPQ